MQEVNMVGRKKTGPNKTSLLMYLDGDTVDLAGNPVSRVSGVSYVPNQKFGKKAATFLSTGYIEVPKTPLTTITGDLTIEFTITIPANLENGVEQIVFSNKAGLFIDYYSNGSANNSGRSCWLISVNETNTGSNRIFVDAPWNDGLPHHFAVSRRNGTFTIFLDGVAKTTIISSIALDGPNINIGNYISPAYGLSKGNMQMFRISNVTRYTGSFTPSANPFILD